MKTKHFCITSVCLVLGISNAMATGSPCTQTVNCDSVTISGTANTFAACAGGTAGTQKCYRAEDGKYYAVIDCMACAKRYSYETSDLFCPNITYQTCGDCDCYSLCGGGWKSTGTAGHEKDLYTYKCNCRTNTCLSNDKTYHYRCAAGYYGKSVGGTSGCTQCPTWSGVYTNAARTTIARGTSIAGSNSDVTSCRFTTGTTYYDVTGTFTLGSNCSYTN